VAQQAKQLGLVNGDRDAVNSLDLAERFV
jgi:hypothetical protein